MSANKHIFAIKRGNNVIAQIAITPEDNVFYEDIQWDSKTGLVTAKVNNSNIRTPIPYEGDGCINLPVLSGSETFTLVGDITEIKFHNWYY